MGYIETVGHVIFGFKNLNQGEEQFFVIIWGVIGFATDRVQKF
jgi:hypothetical protein